MRLFLRSKLALVAFASFPLMQLSTCGLSDREAAGVIQSALTTALAGILQSVFASAAGGNI
jgi:hypothetical protein